MIRESKEKLNNPDLGRERSSPGIHEVGSISLSRHCCRESRFRFQDRSSPSTSFPFGTLINKLSQAASSGEREFPLSKFKGRAWRMSSEKSLLWVPLIHPTALQN